MLRGEMFHRERGRWEMPAGRAGAVGTLGSVSQAEGEGPNWSQFAPPDGCSLWGFNCGGASWEAES